MSMAQNVNLKLLPQQKTEADSTATTGNKESLVFERQWQRRITSGLLPVTICLNMILFLSLLETSAVYAVVTDARETSEDPPSDTAEYDFDWEYIFDVGGGSGVAVDSHWVLTADHVGSHDITYDNTTYEVQESVSHSDADLRLLRYDKAFPGSYPVYTGDFPMPSPSPNEDEPLTGLIVGYGLAGDVNETDDTYSTESGTDEIKRWGDSLIDGQGEDWTNEDYNYTIDYIDLNFDADETPYAGGVAQGDSGGGVVVNDNGTWYIAGTSVLVLGPEDEFTGTRAADLTAYEPWITSTVPEPGTGIIILIISCVVIASRRYHLV